MAEFNWTCPFCRHAQTVSDEKASYNFHELNVGETTYKMPLAYSVLAIGCSNPDCKKVEIDFQFGSVMKRNSYGKITQISEVAAKKVIPEFTSKNIPDYIPKPIRLDYYESCRIVDLSAKASATLARRCLQGMIRDFCGITKKTLFSEVSELKRQFETGEAPRGVSEESFEAIEAIRKVGNIGAHMEGDINVIVDVDPDETKLLIELVETLFEEWYVARYKRQQRLSKVAQIVQEKEAAKQPLEGKSE